MEEVYCGFLNKFLSLILIVDIYEIYLIGILFLAYV